MRWHFSTIVLAVPIGMVPFDRSAAGEPRTLHTIEVLVVNEADLPQEVLQLAEIQALRIFEPPTLR